MTGEVTLQGKVLPVGGVKQKLLAAHRAGLTDVIVARRHEPDLDDVPESVGAEIHIHPVSSGAEALTGWMWISAPTDSGTSSRSGSCRRATMTSVRPARWAASSFCLTPPMGRTLPCSVT